MSENSVRELLTGMASAGPMLERIQAIDGRLAAIRGEERAAGGMLPREEVEARLCAWFRERRENFERGPVNVSSSLTASLVASGFSVGRPLSIAAQRSPGDAAFDLVLWLLGPEVEERAKAALARVEFRSGLGSKERAALRARLGAERAELLAEREGLVDECCEAGVTVPHLPETEQRRAQDAERARQEEAQRRRQAEAERRVAQRENR